MILLLAIAFASYAAKSYDDNEKYEHFNYEELRLGEGNEYNDKLILKPAAFSGESRKVIWRGSSSYPGFKQYDRKNQAKKVTSNSQTYTTSPPRRGRTQINIPLSNKQRANDKRYREGLQELADLT